MSCCVGSRQSSDTVFLWLWCKSAATAPIQPLALETPYAEGASLKIQKKKKILYLAYLKVVKKVDLKFLSQKKESSKN